MSFIFAASSIFTGVADMKLVTGDIVLTCDVLLCFGILQRSQLIGLCGRITLYKRKKSKNMKSR